MCPAGPDPRRRCDSRGTPFTVYPPRRDEVTSARLTGLSSTITDANRHEWPLDCLCLAFDGTRRFLNELRLTEDDRRRIAHRNAESLLCLSA